ncbi:MAG: diguanylate cyclase [Magnetococcales bacterium]|nr:diguanylate cyclase [Magnetococcales bacterium]
MTPPSSRPRTFLLRQATWRIAVSLLLVAIAVAGLMEFVQLRAGEQASREQANRLVRHFRERIHMVEQQQQEQAIRFKATIEHLRIPEDGNTRWLRLREMLSVYESDTLFSAVLITDGAGKILFRFSTLDLHLSETFDVDSKENWFFVEYENVLFRVYRLPLWLEPEGRGFLFLLRPMNNALLFQNAFPETDLALIWKGQVVARSIGLVGQQEMEEKRQPRDGTEIPEREVNIGLRWEESLPNSPRLMVRHHDRYLFSPREIWQAGMILFSGTFLLLWLGSGGWFLSMVRRIMNLGQAAKAFGENHQVDEAFLERARWAKGEQADEIGAVATALEEMAKAVVEREEALQARTEALAASEQRFRTLFEGSRDVVWVVAMNAEGRPCHFLEVNEAAVRRYGFSRRELLQMLPMDLNDPRYHYDLDDLMARFRQAEYAIFERVHLTREGQPIPVEISSSIITYQGEKAILAHVRDISERKQAEMILKESEQRFRAMSDSLRDTLLVTDQAGRIHFWNRGGVEMFGWSESDIRQQGLIGLFDLRWLGEQGLERLELSGHEEVGAFWVVEASNRRASGEIFPSEIHFSTWIRQGTLYFTGIIHDISVRRQLEARDQRAYSNRIAISALLEVGLEPLSLSRKLEICLDILLTVPWLSASYKGCIFLAEADGSLTLVVEKGLRESHTAPCRRVQPGQCLCGRVVLEQEILYSPSGHERPDGGVATHGHYCVPIRMRDTLMGVLNLYLDPQHTRDLEEEAFLTTVANTLAGIVEHGQVEEKVKHLASHDALTGLPNRLLFREHLEQELRRSQRTRQVLAVAFLDLDRFKEVNDTLGHDAGDILLCQTTQRLRQCLRQPDILARMGGDEFTVILPDVGSEVHAVAVAEKILHALAEPFLIQDVECRIGVSIGISLFPRHGSDAELLLQRADAAMYRVKAGGRHNVMVYQDA